MEGVFLWSKKGGKRTQCWYSIKTDAQCFVCQVLARLFALKAIQKGSKQMAGRSCLCYFWTFPLKVSDCCPFPPFPHSCMFFFLPSFPFSFLRTYFFKAYIINHTTSPKSWVCFWQTKLWIVYIFLCLKSDKAVWGLSPEAVQAELGGQAGKPDCHFAGFNSTAAHFPGRLAAVLSPVSKFRLKVW